MNRDIHHNEVALLTDCDVVESQAYIEKMLFPESAKTPTFKPLLRFPQHIGMLTMDLLLHPLLPCLNFTDGLIYEGAMLSYTYQADQEHSAWQIYDMSGYTIDKGTLSQIILSTVREIQYCDPSVKVYLGTNQQHELTIAYYTHVHQLKYLYTDCYRILADRDLQQRNAHIDSSEVFAANIMKYGKPLLCTLNSDD